MIAGGHVGVNCCASLVADAMETTLDISRRWVFMVASFDDKKGLCSIAARPIRLPEANNPPENASLRIPLIEDLDAMSGMRQIYCGVPAFTVSRVAASIIKGRDDGAPPDGTDPRLHHIVAFGPQSGLRRRAGLADKLHTFRMPKLVNELGFLKY